MNEDQAVRKMEDLMESVGTLQKYAKVREKFGLATLVGLISLFFAMLEYTLIEIYNYVVINPFTGTLYISSSTGVTQSVFMFLTLLAGAIVIYEILRRAGEVPVESPWKDDLKEGAIGIMKIMTRYDWGRILQDLRRAKQAFFMFATIHLAFNFFVIFIITFFALGLPLTLFVSVSSGPPFTYFYAVVIVAAVITILVGDSTLKKARERLWSTDTLIMDLRGFYFDVSNREI